MSEGKFTNRLGEFIRARDQTKRILFVWDARMGEPGRRLFYKKLSGYKQGDEYYYPGFLDEIPKESWDWINKSTMLIDRGKAGGMRELLEEYDDVLDWHEFEVIERKI